MQILIRNKFNNNFLNMKNIWANSLIFNYFTTLTSVVNHSNDNTKKSKEMK